jgi:hypothetical protein
MSSTAATAPPPSRRTTWRRRLLYVLAGLLTLYLLTAFVIIPVAWSFFGPGHPALEAAPRVTHTRQGIRGDPVNFAIIASEENLQVLLTSAGWLPSDKITLGSCLRIARCSIFGRPYETAPISDLYLWGRTQDFAFQFPVGNSPNKRHHVRFWRSEKLDDEGRPLWLGSATFDRSSGISRTTLKPTHHIDADVDAERDFLLADLELTELVDGPFWIRGFHEDLKGRNGGGDPYFTDGHLPVVVMR